jgi:RNA polymerase sigma factor (sigma-70 family)
MTDSKKTEQNRILQAYLTCRDGLTRSVMKMCARQEDVDDILQEAYLRAHRKSPIKSPQDYLFVVSRNLVIQKLSRRSREINMEITDALTGVDEVPAHETLHYQQQYSAFIEALRSLPVQQRRAILLRKFYCLSHKEIAAKMNVSVSSVEKYIAGGIRQCKRALRAKGYEVYAHTEVKPPDLKPCKGRQETDKE